MDRIPLLSAADAPRAPAWEVERWFGRRTSLEDVTRNITAAGFEARDRTLGA